MNGFSLSHFSGSESWSDSGEMSSGDFPSDDGAMAPDGVTWWQVRIVGVNADGKSVTPFSNVISFGPVPRVVNNLSSKMFDAKGWVSQILGHKFGRGICLTFRTGLGNDIKVLWKQQRRKIDR